MYMWNVQCMLVDTRCLRIMSLSIMLAAIPEPLAGPVPIGQVVGFMLIVFRGIVAVIAFS